MNKKTYASMKQCYDLNNGPYLKGCDKPLA